MEKFTKAFWQIFKEIVVSIFVRPTYDQDIQFVPMNTPPERPIDIDGVKPPTPIPIPSQSLTLAQIKQAHPSGWCGGNLADRRAMFILANRVCQEEGLSISMTADLRGTVWGESGWNQWCINDKNTNGSADYGIAQFNSNTYLKEFKMTAVDVLTNPEKCLRIMARNFKAGRQRNWFAYRPGDPRWEANRIKGL